MCGATAHVRFTPNSDRESGFLHKVMSALPPKADMCDAISDDGVVSDKLSKKRLRARITLRKSRLMHRSNVHLYSAVTKRTLFICQGPYVPTSVWGHILLCCRIVRLSATGRPLGLQRAMATECRHAPVSIRSAFTGHCTSNMRSVRRADVAHSNRTGWARFGEAHF